MKIQDDLLGQLVKTLANIPELKIQKSKTKLQVKHGSQNWSLPFKTIPNATPATVRGIAAQFKLELQNLDHTYGVMFAPWFSLTSQDILEQLGLGFIDDYGNVRLAFGTTFIRLNATSTPKPETRALKSVFTPASARVLHTLMANPNRTWRLKELSELANVSLGQVHKVIQALLERELAVQHGTGRALDMQLSNPQKLLQDWKNHYLPTGTRQGFYTLLHSEKLQHAIQKTFESLEPAEHLTLAGLSAAKYLAPYARTSTTHFYANLTALEKLKLKLELQPVTRGENVIVQLEPDESIFRHAIQTQNLFVTNPVQTYLDLYQLGERAQEAAEHLNTHVILPAWKNV